MTDPHEPGHLGLGEPGRSPGQFDRVHGMAVATPGAVYAADTYGKRLQDVRAQALGKGTVACLT